MLCQRCGREMYESGSCPECGTARKLPMSGCLDPDTFYYIRSINPKPQPAPAPEQAPTPTGRPRPKAVAREWDIAVPVINPPGGKKAADNGGTNVKNIVTAAVIVVALAASVAGAALKFADDGAAAQKLTVRNVQSVYTE